MTDSLSSSRFQESISIKRKEASEKIIRGIAIFFLLGTGTFLTNWMILSSANGVTLTGIQELASLMLLLALAPFGVTVWAGLYLWQLKPIGFTLSYVSLGMQVIWISGPAFTWDFFSGLRLGVGIDNGAFGTYILFLGSSTVGFNSDHVFGFGINILAIFLIFLLRRTRLNYLEAIKIAESAEVLPPDQQPQGSL